MDNVNYLRVSITDKCNLKCIYCVPEKVNLYPSDYLLSIEDIIKVIKVGSYIGINKIKITGGEALLNKDIFKLIELINNIPSITDISLTTNGILLKNYAHLLFESGLKRINISVDTLSPLKFTQITKYGNLKNVLDGLEKVLELGFNPIKLNVVVIPKLNDDEILDFVNLTIDKPLIVRFIEFMPIGNKELFNQVGYIPSSKIIELLSKHFDLVDSEALVIGSGPAYYKKVKNSKGCIGFISPNSENFCTSCNRLRLTVDGKLKPCLFSVNEIDIKNKINEQDKLLNAIKFAILNKKCVLKNPLSVSNIYKIGG